MNYLLALYHDKKIYELELSQGENATVGSDDSDSLRVGKSVLLPSHLKLSATATGVHIIACESFEVAGDCRAANRMIIAGDIVRLRDNVSMSVFEKRCDIIGVVSLRKRNELTFGRSVDNDIRMVGAQVSTKHAVLRKEDEVWVITDNGSQNGTYVDGEYTETRRVNDESIIFIGGWKFIVSGDTLRFLNTAGDSSIADDLECVGMRRAALSIAGGYPYFQRSPRIVPDMKVLEVEVQPPPDAGAKPSISWLSVLLPPVLMIIVMVSVAMIIKNRTMLYYTVPMALISIIVAIANYNSQTKKWRRTQQLAREKYLEYLMLRENEIMEAESDYLKSLDTVNPSIYSSVQIVRNMDRRLWERSIGDNDFLSVRLGVGNRQSNVSIKVPHMQLSLEEDPLLNEAAALKERHATLSGTPVAISLDESTIVGIAGSRESIQKTAWTLLAGIAVHHSCEDVKIVCIYPEGEKNKWSWVRWLPHVWNRNRTRRFIACTASEARPLLRELDDLLKTRRRGIGDSYGRRGEPDLPYYVLFLMDKSLVESSGVQLLPESGDLGMSVIFAYGDIAELPDSCQAIVDCTQKKSLLIFTSGIAKKMIFIPEKVPLSLMDSFARGMAPIRLRSSAETSGMSDYVTFLQGYGVTRVEELDILGRWSRSRPFESIAAPIGIRENGDIFSFDIHEKGMGPHGIVAGATRWGKSETLTTWLLSVALNYHPHEVSFVLIDFKGDGLSGILMELPHVAGKISNVQDISSIERNLRSLQGELLRRQRVFMETKLENIHKYQEAYRSGRVSEPMAYLIIVIDEFAELKTQFPDQMDGFISIARVGGSLGVYMVLATQSPGGGIVSGQVSANSRFRICLKTSEIGESKDIIGTGDAFKITTRGRAYVKVGNNEVYEQVQTFFSKAPYKPGSQTIAPMKKINIVELNGERTRPEIYDKSVGAAFSDFGEGRAVAYYIKEHAENAGIVNARQVWTEAMPEKVFLTDFIGKSWNDDKEGLAIVAGLIDDPENQRQYPLVLDFFKDGHQVVYGAPSSGKTTFLQTVLLSAAASYTPEQVQFLALDFGSWGMKVFEKLPHTIIVADSNEQEKIKKAEDFLKSELAVRKRRFSEQGVGTLAAYREVTGEVMPAMIVAIDNMAALYAIYPDLLDSLTDIAREGGGLGLFLIMTAGSQGSFMFRVAQYVKSSFALQLTDKADYRQLVGGNGRIEPARYPGRGFAKGPLEFQTALCVRGATDGERARRLREMCEEIRSSWNGQVASMDAMSSLIRNKKLLFDAEHVQIGFDVDSGKVCDFAFREMNGCVISGLPGSGKTNLLGLLANALDKREGTRLYIFEKGSFLQALCSNTKVFHDGENFDALLTEVGEEYDLRSENGNDSPMIAFCIDDFTQFYEEISDESAGILDRIVRYGAEYGIYVYVAGDKTGMERFHNLSVKLLENCLAGGHAIALGGKLKDYGIFTGFFTGDDVVLGLHEGAFIADGKARCVRFALAGSENGD